MKFIGARELRLNPSQVWKDLEEGGEVVVTTNGKPKAVMTSADEANWEDVLRAIRRSRAQLAVSRLRRGSKKDITAAYVDREIGAVRKGLRGRW